MREVSQVFKEGFSIGLPPEPTIGPDTQCLAESLNMIPTKLGLEPRDIIWNPTDTTTANLPFPALYVLSRYTLLFTAQDLYKVDGDSLTHLYSFSWEDLPHIADFADYIVFSTPAGQWAFDGSRVTKDVGGALFKTCVNFRGQLLIANCQLPKGPARIQDDIAPNQVPVGGPSIVAWSKIGAIDWEYTLGNEVGWTPMPWQGTVLGMLPLGKEVVVYGDNGLVKLALAKEPVATFGIQEFGDIGVLNRNCFAGDFTTHLFVGTDYALYASMPERALSGEGKLPTRLGYSDLLKTLENPVMSFDPVKRYWWIGDSKRCFIYTGVGLGEASETPTHLARLGDDLVGVSLPHHPHIAVVETNDISFDSRGFKTLMCVECDTHSNAPIYGMTRFSCDYLSSKLRTSFRIPLDPRGAYFPIIAGTEIRVRLECEDFRNFWIHKMWLHFKNTDKTFSRGIINAGRPAN